MKQIKDLLFCMLLFFGMTIPASADLHTQTVYFSANKDVLIYNGEISEGAVNRVKELYNVHKFKIISITSNGGDYDPGMLLAKFSFENHLKVYVPQYCASACTFTFFGVSMYDRDIAPTALIGLHNISFAIVGADASKVKVTANEAMEFAQEAVIRSGTMLSLYAANGVPPDVLYRVARSYGNNIVNIQRGDLLRWGIIQKR